MDGAVRLYTLDWDGPFQYAGEVLASVPQSQQEDYTAYFQQVNSNNSRTLAKLAVIVRNSAAGHTYKDFVPAYAAVWSWTRNSTNVSLCNYCGPFKLPIHLYTSYRHLHVCIDACMWTECNLLH